LSFPYPARNFRSREAKYRRNGKIRAREVRVIDENKEQLGVMPLSEALRLAQTKGLDLLETVPNAVPPVCRIVDYGKFQYEESKRAKESHTKQAASKMKELQLSPVIAVHDFDTKLAHAIQFLSEDMKVCVKLRFRGRQRAHKEYGFQVVNRFVAEAAAYGRADSPPKMLGERDLTVIISPLPRDKRAKVAPGAARPAAVKPSASSTRQSEPSEPVQTNSDGAEDRPPLPRTEP
jgi:translation initiation factor IF-3